MNYRKLIIELLSKISDTKALKTIYELAKRLVD